MRLTRNRRCRADDAIILYMATLPVAEARARLSKLVEEAASTHERFEVTRNGQRAAEVPGVDVDGQHPVLAQAVEVGVAPSRGLRGGVGKRCGRPSPRWWPTVAQLWPH